MKRPGTKPGLSLLLIALEVEVRVRACKTSLPLLFPRL